MFFQQKIEKDERTLFALLQKSQAKLENLHKVYQFFYDAENVRGWLSEKLKVAGAEGYGKDFEHWQVCVIYTMTVMHLSWFQNITAPLEE